MTDNQLRYSTYSQRNEADDSEGPPTSIVVTDRTPGPIQSVMWIPGNPGTWKFDRALISPDWDNLDVLHRVDRAEAERIAREFLGTELPSPEEFHRILAEGRAELNSRRWQASAIRMFGRPWVSMGPVSPVMPLPHPEYRQILYIATYQNLAAERPNGVAAVTPWREKFRAVAWAPGLQRWIFAGEQVRKVLRQRTSNSDNLKELVDRPTAERIAREVLGTELPSEAEIHRICTEATGQPTPNMDPAP
jgi:hypothetical protein